MATDGDQYLKTPEHLLPWHVRTMLDVYLALAAIFGGLIWLMLLGLRRLLFGRRQQGGSGNQSSCSREDRGAQDLPCRGILAARCISQPFSRPLTWHASII